MSDFSISEVAASLIPAILAGVIGGLGAYVAVREDIAVLLSNQSALIDQGKEINQMVARHDSEINLLQYQVEVLGKDVEEVVARR